MAVKLNGDKNNTKRRCPELRPQKKKKSVWGPDFFS